jgi:hypothetical protein
MAVCVRMKKKERTERGRVKEREREKINKLHCFLRPALILTRTQPQKPTTIYKVQWWPLIVITLIVIIVNRKTVRKYYVKPPHNLT